MIDWIKNLFKKSTKSSIEEFIPKTHIISHFRMGKLYEGSAYNTNYGLGPHLKIVSVCGEEASRMGDYYTTFEDDVNCVICRQLLSKKRMYLND
jgi:hypothetical protein